MKELLQISRTELNLGLKKEYRFFQISDAHIAYIDEKSSQIDIEDHKRSKTQWNKLKIDFANQFGEHYDSRYSEVEAHEIFEALMEYACGFNSDAIILSGDIMDRVTDSNIRYLKNKIKSVHKKVIYCPGNHASHDEYGIHRNMYDRFEGLIENPEIDVFEFDELKVITVDNGAKNITDNQIKALKNEISKDKKILLVLHAPINLGEFGKVMSTKIGGYFLLGSNGDSENAFEFIRLIKENSNKFIAVLAGHIHASVEYPIAEGLVQYTTSSALIGKGREIIVR